MTEFQTSFRPREDPAKHLAFALGFFGSISFGTLEWAWLLRNMGVPVLPYQAEAMKTWKEQGSTQTARDLVCRVVPEEGDPYPQRATVDTTPIGDVVLTTPGGVKVQLWWCQNSETVGLYVDFGRDSRFASVCVLARLYESTGAGANNDFASLHELLVQALTQ